MKPQYYIFFLGIYSCSLFAQTPPPDRTNFPENNIFTKPNLLLNSQIELDYISPDLPQEHNTLEELINYAIISKKWETLEKILEIYKDTPNYDPILYKYGLGALYRYKGNYKKAIKTYYEIINSNPNLIYPRFDLGMMLFENKQLNEAERELKKIHQQMPENIRKLIDQILESVDYSQKIIPQFNMNYERTSNVNQASKTKEVLIGDAVFIRDSESLPQKAHGLSYKLGISNSNNIFGNHYSYFGLNLNGTSYWDNKDYSEQTLQFSLGYQYKNYDKILGVIPFIEQNILGNNRYGIKYGLNFNYSQKITTKLQFSSNTVFIQKKYNNKDLANIYNGKSYSQSLFLNYLLQENKIFYSGLDFTNDLVKDSSESSKRTGIQIGLLYDSNYLSFDSNLRYGKRKFDSNNNWYNQKRIDDEYQLNLSIWKKQWQWKGFTPRLNYSYQEIKSNLPLYTRDINNIFISINRNF